MDPERVRVVVVEDHPLYRYALRQALSRDPRLVVADAFADGATALEALRSTEDCVVLLDLDLPGLDGLSLLERLDAARSPLKFVVLSADKSGTSVCRAIEYGASGYLSKDLDADGICEATVAAARGETVISRQLQGHMADQLRAQRAETVPSLTPRERDVLNLAAEGLTVARMARQLCIGQTTVKTHLAAIYAKLGARDRASAMVEAMKHGLIETSRSY